MNLSCFSCRRLGLALAWISSLGLVACLPTATPMATPTLPPTASLTTAAPPVSGVSYGAHVEIIGMDSTPILNGVTAMRFNWIAQTIYWRDLEPQPGRFDWEGLDETMRLLDTGGYDLQILAVVRGTPDWARPAGADLLRDGPPADYATLAKFVGALADRYAGRIAAYEIYPGANDARHWASPTGLSPQDYTAMLQLASSAIRSADPLAVVVSGGLVPTDVNDGVNSVDDLQFLAGMYAAGAAQWFDVVGVHLDGRNNPPSDTPEFSTVSAPSYKGLSVYYFRHYEQVRTVMLANNDSQHPMWLTAVGWASQSPPPETLPFAADNSEDDQAAYLVSAAYQVRQRPYVQVMIVENFNLSTVEGPDSPSAAYSLIRPDWSARPAFLALAKMRQADLLSISAKARPAQGSR